VNDYLLQDCVIGSRFPINNFVLIAFVGAVIVFVSAIVRKKARKKKKSKNKSISFLFVISV